MKADIWMPLYIGDYLADTSRLTTEQHGAYLLLLMDYWKSGKLPDNDQVLAQICKLTPDAWSNAKAMLMPYFSIEQGFWVHKRVEQEIAEAKVNQQKKHDRAVKAAEARWKNAPSNANAMLEECPSPSPSPSPINNNIEKKSSRGSRFKEESLPDEWREYSLKTRPDLNPASVFEDFKDYWVSMAGSKGVRADWLATWRGWVRRQNASSKSFKTAGDRNQDVMSGLTRGLIGGGKDVRLLGK
jgi:uncharacterized protein YdaU (DUF1376 family)